MTKSKLKLFIESHRLVIEKAQEVLKNLSDIEVLYKAGITIKGKITRTTLLFSKNRYAKWYLK